MSTSAILSLISRHFCTESQGERLVIDQMYKGAKLWTLCFMHPALFDSSLS